MLLIVITFLFHIILYLVDIIFLITRSLSAEVLR